MVLVLFIAIIVLLWILNIFLEDRDLLSPSCVFTMMIFGSLLMCVVSSRDYDFELHWNTMFVILTGAMVFTGISAFRYFARSRSAMVIKMDVKENASVNNQFTPIQISPLVNICFVVLEVLVGYFAAKYVIDVAVASTGSFTGISAAIGIYDNLQKFDLETLQALNVSRHVIYSLGWPLLTSVSYILIYVTMHNLVLVKKIEVLPLAIVLGYFALTFLSGGRTYAFRVITAFVACFYYFRCIRNGFHKRQLSFLIKMIGLAIVVVAFFMLMRQALGRSMSNYKWYHTFFSYFGAPIVNLDYYLQQGDFPSSTLWAQESLYGLYNFIGNRFNIPEFIYSLDLPFVYYTGRNTGNVYTMFYQFIHDFGYLGIIPMTWIIAYVFDKLYRATVRTVKRKESISFAFFMYSYLINDLVMLTFSNKFYETTVAINFLRFMVCSVIIWYCIVDKRVFFANGKIIVSWKKANRSAFS